MKKIVLLFTTALVSTGAFAQNFEWGVKGGLNLANVTGTEGESKMKPSIHLGVFAEFQIHDFITLQPELIYSRQGFNVKVDEFNSGNDFTGKGTVNFRLNYINVPFIFKFYVLEGLSLDLGPQVGLLLNTKAAYDGNTAKVDEGTSDLDVSFAMGLSCRLTNRLDLSGRYNLGLTDWVQEGDSKNGVIQFGVGYRF